MGADVRREEARRLVDQTALEIGVESCLNHECVFGHPGGASTRDGCLHLKGSGAESRTTIRLLGQVAHALALRVIEQEAAAAERHRALVAELDRAFASAQALIEQIAEEVT